MCEGGCRPENMKDWINPLQRICTGCGREYLWWDKQWVPQPMTPSMLESYRKAINRIPEGA